MFVKHGGACFINRQHRKSIVRCSAKPAEPVVMYSCSCSKCFARKDTLDRHKKTCSGKTKDTIL